jgi:hypothetical protein
MRLDLSGILEPFLPRVYDKEKRIGLNDLLGRPHFEKGPSP